MKNPSWRDIATRSYYRTTVAGRRLEFFGPEKLGSDEVSSVAIVWTPPPTRADFTPKMEEGFSQAWEECMARMATEHDLGLMFSCLAAED